MPHAGHTVTVNPPAGTVFDYLADGTHDTEWRSGVLEIERTSPADGKGATYRQVLSGPGGRRIDGDYRVTVFNPPTRLEFQVVAGPARPAGVFELTETTPGTTTVRFTLDLRPPGLTCLPRQPARRTPCGLRGQPREPASLRPGAGARRAGLELDLARRMRSVPG